MKDSAISQAYDFTRTRQLLEQHVQAGYAAGISAQVIRHGETIFATQVGLADKEKGTPLTSDTIFRFYSMTKPMTAALLLMLYEQGRLQLHDPVSDYLPGFANSMVYEKNPDGTYQIVPAKRPITIRHLLTMTSGLTYHGDESPTSQGIGKILQEAITRAATDPEAARTVPIINRMGQVPMAFHPGEQWRYGFSLDVIGAVIEVICGKRLSTVMQEMIFEPLGMKDSGFCVAPEKIHRLATLYAVGNDGQLHVDTKGLLATDPTVLPTFEQGGAGLFSTRSDYARFARLLLGFGELEGTRLLSRKTVELMRADHLTAEQKTYYNWDSQRGYSYGLGVRTLVSPAAGGSNGSVGEFGWDGAAGTWFGVDPAEDLVAIYLVQRLPGNHAPFYPQFPGHGIRCPVNTGQA